MSLDRFATMDDRAEVWGANTVRCVRRCNSITNLCSRSVRSVRFVHLWCATMLFSDSNDELQSESVVQAKRASEPQFKIGMSRLQRCNSITNLRFRSVRSARFVHLRCTTMLFSNSNDELKSESVAQAKRASEPQFKIGMSRLRKSNCQNSRTEMQFDHEPVLSKRQKRTPRTFVVRDNVVLEFK